ncbi:hypothetical protein B0J18DRAFT_451939 [Chaetomium sp. MPI-SDFR-AT-0129]|nr:hypothetical protein B0J18DRAFT_451939 [Chaetomium sp. MPI-SDFR-AT-0129]
MAQVYVGLEDEIAQFFARTSATREECDNFALAAFGGQVEPVSIQGATSYTVVAEQNREKIVQFRNMDAQLDMGMLDLARRIHGDVLPRGSYPGCIGDESGLRLAVYGMDRIRGDSYGMVRGSLGDFPDRQLATTRSLARFFAQSWSRPVSPNPSELTAIATELSNRLDDAASSGILATCHEPVLDEVREHMPTFVSGDFPLVLTHSDLTELNILVDGDTGIITGVVDWVDAAVQPFGLTLYALDKFIGGMGPSGWVYFDNANALRSVFWTAFAEYAGIVSNSQMRSIEVARKAGYLLRYGTYYDSNYKGVVGVEQMSVERRRLYLHAIL